MLFAWSLLISLLLQAPCGLGHQEFLGFQFDNGEEINNEYMPFENYPEDHFYSFDSQQYIGDQRVNGGWQGPRRRPPNAAMNVPPSTLMMAMAAAARVSDVGRGRKLSSESAAADRRTPRHVRNLRLSFVKFVNRLGFEVNSNASWWSFCRTNPCRNGATCRRTAASQQCLCRTGFTGSLCQDADACLSDPCLHGGVCVSSAGNFRCICPPRATGKFCENGRFGELQSMREPAEADPEDRLDSDFAAQPEVRTGIARRSGVNFPPDAVSDRCGCRNGGRCCAGGYGCVCPDNYYGKFCEHGCLYSVDGHKEGSFHGFFFERPQPAQVSSCTLRISNLNPHFGLSLPVVRLGRNEKNCTRSPSVTVIRDGRKLGTYCGTEPRAWQEAGRLVEVRLGLTGPMDPGNGIVVHWGRDARPAASGTRSSSSSSSSQRRLSVLLSALFVGTLLAVLLALFVGAFLFFRRRDVAAPALYFAKETKVFTI